MVLDLANSKVREDALKKIDISSDFILPLVSKICEINSPNVETFDFDVVHPLHSVFKFPNTC